MSISTFLNTVILLGALQGFIVAGLLRSSARQKPEERVSRRLLAAFILLIALCCLDVYLEHQEWWNGSTVGSLLSALLPLIMAMPLGPLAYFYIRSLEEPEFRLTRAERRHFYPVVIDLLPHAAVLVVVVLALLGFFRKTHGVQGFGVVYDDYNQYADIPRWISFTIYLVLGTRYLRRRAGGRAGASHEGGESMRSDGMRRVVWAGTFMRVLWAFDLLWLAFNIPYELPRIGDILIDKFDWYPLYIPLVVMIYYLGVKGYFISYRAAGDGDVLKGLAPVVMIAEEKKAVGIVIPEEKVDQLVSMLKRSMDEERLWLHADLNLGRLAQHCGVAPKLLSAVLNQHMDTTFNDYVNGYRVRAVKERMLQPASRALTIAGLAYDCGFNSLPTFQRAFKTIAGMSPKEYLAVRRMTDGHPSQSGAGGAAARGGDGAIVIKSGYE
jgi:AraC-like DNA-binding protein